MAPWELEQQLQQAHEARLQVGRESWLLGGCEEMAGEAIGRCRY